MTFDEWVESFNPEENLLDENARFGGIMFATDGAECVYVCKAHPKRIWTYHLDTHGNRNIIKGFISDGALGYFLCDKKDDIMVFAIKNVEGRELNG